MLGQWLPSKRKSSCRMLKSFVEKRTPSCILSLSFPMFQKAWKLGNSIVSTIQITDWKLLIFKIDLWSGIGLISHFFVGFIILHVFAWKSKKIRNYPFTKSITDQDRSLNLSQLVFCILNDNIDYCKIIDFQNYQFHKSILGIQWIY